MSSSATGSRRPIRHTIVRAVTALLLAVALLGAPVGAKPATGAGGGWYEGAIQYSYVTNCVSIIQGLPYLELGAGVYVGYYANPDTSLPAVNQVYYVHAVMYGLGNACSGQYGAPYLVLPKNTQLAISGTNPVRCYTAQGQDTVNCPQSLPFNSGYGGYLIKPTSQTMWPLPQGGAWEFQVPVISSTTLTSEPFGAYFVMADGNANPTIPASQNVFVFSGTSNPKPAIVYPTPTTREITRTAAKSYANIYTGGLGGTVHFQLGTTASYGAYESSFHLDAGQANWELFDDWTPTVLTPDTLYHFRMWFDPDTTGLANVFGTDQTFRTLGAARTFAVGGLAGGQPGGTALTVTVTAKDASAAPQTSTTYRGTVQFSSDDVNAQLPADYTFTAGDNGSKTFTVKFMTAGTHTLTVRDKADSSITGAQGGVSVTSTVTPPTATITALSAWKASLSTAVAWNGAGGAVNYDVRYRKAAYSGAFGSPVVWKSATTAKSGTFAAAAGSTYCWSARSRATSGAVSAWTKETCTAIPLDERSMTKSGRWTAGSGSAYYKSTYLRSTTKGAKLTRSGTQAKRIALVAQTCPTCGKASVYLNGTLLKTVSLVSSTTRNKRIIPIATFSDVRTGTLVVKVATSGKKVLVDGVVISRN